jgi:hypothetical protein
VIDADGNATLWNATTMPGGYMLPSPHDVGPPMAPSAAQLGWTTDAGIVAAGFVAADPIGVESAGQAMGADTCRARATANPTIVGLLSSGGGDADEPVFMCAYVSMHNVQQ